MKNFLLIFILLIPLFVKSQCSNFEYKTNPGLDFQVTTVTNQDFRNNKFDWRKNNFLF